MIIEEQSIAYTNVISKEYYFHYTEMEEVLKEFMSSIIDANLTIKGPMFYALKNMPSNEMMYIELFMPIKEEKIPQLEDMRFRSYYYVDNMLMRRYTGDFEKLTKHVYAEMFQYIEKEGLTMVSPIYHILSGDEALQYVDVKIVVDFEEE